MHAHATFIAHFHRAVYGFALVHLASHVMSLLRAGIAEKADRIRSLPHRVLISDSGNGQDQPRMSASS
jgi:hypothetical protein